MEYDFILDSMTYSFSSASSYETCPYGFYLTYIEAKDRKKNFYSDFGLLCHKIMELYFANELEENEMANYYLDHYDEFVTSPPPTYPKGIDQKAYIEGLEFFKDFSFNKEDYEVVFIEETVYYEEISDNFKLVVKPDLVLKDKKTGEYIMIDYKTSKLKENKWDDVKIEGYKRQFLLYIHYLQTEKNIKIDKLQVWFIKNKILKTIPFTSDEVNEKVNWFKQTIEKIKTETEWNPNNSKSNAYFCHNLCSVADDCEYQYVVED